MIENIIIYPINLRTDYPVVTITENEHGKFTSFISYAAEIICPQYSVGGENNVK